VLTTKEYEKIMDFLSTIESSNHNYYQTVINSLKDIFNYNYIAFFVNDNKRRPIASNLPAEVIEEYANQYYSLDIFNNKRLHQKQNVISIHDIMPYHQYIHTPYYEQFNKRHNLDYSISIPLKVNNELIGGIGIHKSKDCGDFSPAEKMIFANISTFISVNLKKNVQATDLEFHYNVLTKSLESLSVGIIVIDSDVKTVYHNKISREYCSDLAMSIDTNPINKIKGIIFERFPFSSRDQCRFEFELGDYDLSIEPLTDVHHVFNQHKQLFAIYLQPKSKQKNYINNAIEQYGLSKREAEIIDLISKGYGNNEIASTLFLSINTVKSHLNNIFNKLNVNNRTAVIHKVVNLN
jgi:DNA-binding CsgD family transcriptional regulator